MRANDDRLELALKASNEGIWDWDMAGDRFYFSNRVLMFLEMGGVDTVNIFAHQAEYVHPDDLSGFQEAWEAVMSGGASVFAVEPRIKSHTGHYKWFRVRAVPVRNEAGVTVRMVGSLIDISKRKKAENALIEERSLIDLVLDNVPVNVYFKDTESRFVRANLATAKRLGLERVEDLIGKTDVDFFGIEHAAKSRATEVQVMETGEEQKEHLQYEVWEDGRQSWGIVTKKVWRGMEGEVLGTFGVTHDVTELMHTQEKIEQVASELRAASHEIDGERHLLRLLIDNIPMFIYFKNERSEYAVINQVMIDSLGLSTHEEAVGRHDRDFFAVELSEAAGEDERLIMKNQKPLLNKLEEIPWRDGRTSYHLSSKFPWLDSEGKVLGIFGVSSDVTALIEAQNKLSAAADELASQNKAMAEQLSLAKEIQQAAVPVSLPTVTAEGWQVEFCHAYQPATDLAGDFLEVIPLGDSKVSFLVCDVMGHGVRAALIVSMLRGLIEKQRAMASEPAKFVEGLNDGLSHLLERTGLTMFATAIYGVFDLAEGSLRFTAAGHPAPIVKRDGEVAQMILEPAAKGAALGMIPEMAYGETILSLAEVDGLWAFTDGVFEVQNGEDEDFGIARMCEVLRADLPCAEGIGNLSQKALDFAEGDDFGDDLCILGMEITSRA